MSAPSIRHVKPAPADVPSGDGSVHPSVPSGASGHSSPSSPSGDPSEISLDPLALTPGERHSLLRCARAAIAAATGAGTDDALRAAIDAAAGLDRRAAAFVTLTVEGDLRGCMGSLDPDQSVLQAVVTAATSSAVRDPRFRPVAPGELPAIHVEVSVLGPRTALARPEDFRPGIDGVVVERGWQAALLLPDVATEYGWDAVDMFEAVCQKAGLSRDAWKDAARDAGRGERTRLYSFRTVRFGGPAIDDRAGVSPSRARK